MRSKRSPSDFKANGRVLRYMDGELDLYEAFNVVMKVVVSRKAFDHGGVSISVSGDTFYNTEVLHLVDCTNGNNSEPDCTDRMDACEWLRRQAMSVQQAAREWGASFNYDNGRN